MAAVGQLPMDFLVPRSDWKPPRLADLPQDWSRFNRISIDTETRDDLLGELGCGARRGAYTMGYCLAFEGIERGFYLPIRHVAGGNMEEGPDAVRRYVLENAATYRSEVIGMNLGYDLDMLAQDGIEFPRETVFRDVANADPLLYEHHDRYSLDAILKRHGFPGKNEDLLKEALLAHAPKKTAPTKLKRYMYLLHSRLVGPYAEADALDPLRLLRVQEKLLDERGLRKVWDLESKLLPALVRMRRRGIRVHEGRLAQIDDWSRKQEEELWAEVARLSGVRLNVGQAMEARAVARVLDAVGVEYGTTKTGAPSIDKLYLERLDHPVGALIRRVRKMSQLRTTFVASIRKHAIVSPDGEWRIHGTLNQLKRQKEGGDGDDDGTEGAGPGRLSGSNPNMQQQPARDPEIGPMWRSIYLPERGSGWGALDYSQQEPKFLIDCACRTPIGDPRRRRGAPLGISEKAKMAALEAAARFRENPSLDNYDDFTRAIHGARAYDPATGKVIKKIRDEVKQIYLGRVYGMGPPKMARAMGLEVVWGKDWKGRDAEVAGPEAQALIEKFDAGVPYAREMATMLTTLADERGYIVTHSGRRVHYVLYEGRYVDTQKALNNEVQGSSADETKEAVVRLDEAGHYIQLQVHDEIDGSFDTRDDAEEAAEIMRRAIPKNLPAKVDVEFGASWGEAK